MYTHIYVYTCIYMHIYMHTYVYICIYMYIYVCIYIYIYKYSVDALHLNIFCLFLYLQLFKRENYDSYKNKNENKKRHLWIQVFFFS